MKEMSLGKVNEWYGDNELSMMIPDGWDIDVAKMKGHDVKAMSREELKDALEHPIGTKTISELAKGKHGRIAILVDDLTRATPAHELIPIIIEELHRAGISDRQIFILAALGTHIPIGQVEFTHKVGREIMLQYECVNHNVWEHFHDFGRTRRGTEVSVNIEYARADLRISIGHVRKYMVGPGGGGKIIMPGVSSISSIKQNHNGSRTHPRPKNWWQVNGHEQRADIQEYARMAGLDFCINCTLNGQREIIGVHAGDVDDAWLSGVRYAYEQSLCNFPNKVYDIVVLNQYMFNEEPISQGTLRTLGRPDLLREGGTAVFIHEHPQGVSIFRYNHEMWGAVYRRMAMHPRRRELVKHAGNTIIYDSSPAMGGAHGKAEYSETIEYIGKVKELENRLQALHKGTDAKVLVVPLAQMTTDPIKQPLVIGSSRSGY